MKLVHTHATHMLVEKAESIEQAERHSWRCVYMRLHDKQERFNRELRAHFINRAIVDILARDEGHIYFCDDGDIFMVFEGALKPVADKLSKHFGDLDPDQLRGNSESGMFSFFDLGKHWEGFYELCLDKLNRVVPARDRLQPVAVQTPSDARISA